jgi:phage antirepressor YoqD-like protein
MNELALFAGTYANAMTVKQVAEALGVTPEAIKKHIRDLYPELMRDGAQTMLDERQVTEIKRRMMPTTQVVGATTALDIAEMTLKVISYHKAEADRLRAEMSIAAPKIEAFDRFLDASGSLCLQDAGKQLGRHPNLFIKELGDSGYLFKRAGDWLPVQHYLDLGWFTVKTRTYGEGDEAKITKQTRVTPKGLDALAKIF